MKYVYTLTPLRKIVGKKKDDEKKGRILRRSFAGFGEERRGARRRLKKRNGRMGLMGFVFMLSTGET